MYGADFNDKWRETYYLTEADQYDFQGDQGDYELSPESVDYNMGGYWNPFSADSIFRMKPYWIGVSAGITLGILGHLNYVKNLKKKA